MTRSARPVFLNLAQIQMPVGALTSIGHRVTGILLAAGTPFAVYLFDRSLQNEQGFADVSGLLGHGAVKVAIVLVVWALAHHVLAGVRHLLSDFDVGSSLRLARRSAWFVNLGGVAVALLAAGVLARFRKSVDRGAHDEAVWDERMSAYAGTFPDLYRELQQRLRGELPPGWDADIPVFAADPKGIATRVASGKVMNAVAPRVPALTGGSADLDPSTHTALGGLGDFNPPAGTEDDRQGSAGGGWSHAGRNLHFGVREHAMGAIVNGMAAHGGTLPYGSTFLIFSDHMRPPIRLAALMGLHVVHVFTHDSIAVGEDGPTHQPVEQLASLRAIPNLTVIRPGDANETAVAWRVALEARDRPVLLEGIAVRCVSMPSWELFDALPQAERDMVLPPSVSARLAVEAGVAQGWHRYVGAGGDVLSVERFGASAPAEDLLREYGFTVDNVCARALALRDR